MIQLIPCIINTINFNTSLLTDIIRHVLILIPILIYLAIALFLFGIITYCLIGCWNVEPKNYYYIKDNKEKEG